MIAPQKTLKKKPSFRFPQYHTSIWILEIIRDATYQKSTSLTPDYRESCFLPPSPYVLATLVPKRRMAKSTLRTKYLLYVFPTSGRRVITSLCSHISIPCKVLGEKLPVIFTMMEPWVPLVPLHWGHWKSCIYCAYRKDTIPTLNGL